MKIYSFNLFGDENDLNQKIKKICGNWWKKFKIEMKQGERGEFIFSIDGSEIVSFNSDHFSYKKLFDGIINFFKQEYSSLDYSFKNYNPQKNTLTILNNRQQEFLFIGRDIVQEENEVFFFMVCLRQALELFINAEIAILKSYIALKDAKARNRIDLIVKYTEQMSELVKLTCFTEILKAV